MLRDSHLCGYINKLIPVFQELGRVVLVVDESGNDSTDSEGEKSCDDQGDSNNEVAANQCRDAVKNRVVQLNPTTPFFVRPVLGLRIFTTVAML